jgi:hypothetical protein
MVAQAAHLGSLYERGADGITRDYSTAAEWCASRSPRRRPVIPLTVEGSRYHRGGEAGNVASLNNLACLQLRGLGVEKDVNAAFDLFLRAHQEARGCAGSGGSG